MTYLMLWLFPTLGFAGNKQDIAKTTRNGQILTDMKNYNVFWKCEESSLAND